MYEEGMAPKWASVGVQTGEKVGAGGRLTVRVDGVGEAGTNAAVSADSATATAWSAASSRSSASRAMSRARRACQLDGNWRFVFQVKPLGMPLSEPLTRRLPASSDESRADRRTCR